MSVRSTTATPPTVTTKAPLRGFSALTETETSGAAALTAFSTLRALDGNLNRALDQHQSARGERVGTPAKPAFLNAHTDSEPPL